MRKLNKTYHWFLYLIFTVFIVSCGAGQSKGMEDNVSEEKKESMVAATEDENSSEMATEGSSQKKISLNVKMWKNKAQQQLETIQDLTLILNDPSLDLDFKAEINKELKSLYENEDSSHYQLSSQELNFKNFKDLQIESGDTMSLQFKNKKDILLAKFIVIQETKTFGESTEVVDQLKLISIRKVD